MLASLDPLAAMARAEKDALAALLAEIETDDAALERIFARANTLTTSCALRGQAL